MFKMPIFKKDNYTDMNCYVTAQFDEIKKSIIRCAEGIFVSFCENQIEMKYYDALPLLSCTYWAIPHLHRQNKKAKYVTNFKHHIREKSSY